MHSHERILSVQDPRHEVEITDDRRGAHVSELVSHGLFAHVELNLEKGICLFLQADQSLAEEGIACICDPDVVSPLENRMRIERGPCVTITRKAPSTRADTDSASLSCLSTSYHLPSLSNSAWVETDQVIILANLE